MNNQLLRTASIDAAIRAAYAAGSAAPADPDAATEALAHYCRRNGCRPGDPVTEAWVLGWSQENPGLFESLADEDSEIE